MYTFPQLIKNIRKEADLTQKELADALEVSTALIAMVETGQKEVSKKLVTKLAELMDVHPSSITPFLFTLGEHPSSKVERLFISYGEKMQEHLIKNRAKKLKAYAKAD